MSMNFFDFSLGIFVGVVFIVMLRHWKEDDKE